MANTTANSLAAIGAFTGRQALGFAAQAGHVLQGRDAVEVNAPLWGQYAPYSTQTCIMLYQELQRHCFVPVVLFTLFFGGRVQASLGDRLPEFRSCVDVCQMRMRQVPEVEC